MNDRIAIEYPHGVVHITREQFAEVALREGWTPPPKPANEPSLAERVCDLLNRLPEVCRFDSHLNTPFTVHGAGIRMGDAGAYTADHLVRVWSGHLLAWCLMRGALIRKSNMDNGVYWSIARGAGLQCIGSHLNSWPLATLAALVECACAIVKEKR